MGKRWTAEEDARLATLRGEGLTAETIGHQLGRTTDAAQSRAISLGLTRHKKTHCKRGHPISGPGADVRIRAGARHCQKCVIVRRHSQSGPVNRNGRVPGIGRWTAEEERILVKMWNAGEPVTAIVEAIGRNTGAVLGKISTWGKRIGLVSGKSRREGIRHPPVTAEVVVAYIRNASEMERRELFALVGAPFTGLRLAREIAESGDEF